MRHMPVITLMRGLIQSGRIGQVKAVWVRRFVGHGGTARTGDEQVNFTKLRRGSDGGEGGVFDAGIVMFDPNESFHGLTSRFCAPWS